MGNDKEATKLLLQELLLKLMGTALDAGRMAITTDRQFTQFSKSVKNEARQLAADGARLLDAAANDPK